MVRDWQLKRLRHRQPGANGKIGAGELGADEPPTAAEMSVQHCGVAMKYLLAPRNLDRIRRA